MKALLIAEKPDLMRKIQKVYNTYRNQVPYDITFVSQRGHLLTLKLPDEIDENQKIWKWENLPFHPEDHGGWQYKVISEKRVGNNPTSADRLKTIKQELNSGQYDFVIHAGDAEQEGELLIRIVLSYLKNKLPVKRFWNNNTTDKGILDALLNLRDDDNDPMLVNLLKAAYIRQHSDYRIGMNISEAASLQMKTRAACGRVKTPILAIVCRREDEIKNFVPSTTYGVKALYNEGFEGQLWNAKAEDDEDENEQSSGFVYFKTEKEAKEFIAKLQSPGKIIEYKTTRTETLAPKLFKLSTAQIEAGKLGYSPSATLDIIQSLYEKGYLSYPRTACEYITSDEDLPSILSALMSIPEFTPFLKMVNNEAINKVKKSAKWVNDKATREEGHTALIPTPSKVDLAQLSKDEQAIYTMIAKQFLAIFLPPLIQDKTLIVTDINGYLFKTNGKTLIDEGYTKLFGTSFKDVNLPIHNKGDLLDVDKFDITTKTTVCPKRYTQADLIKVCESPGKFLMDDSFKDSSKNLTIGQASTRSSIISGLITRDKYLETETVKKTEYVKPTPNGYMIYNNLKNCNICRVDMTALWEKRLESVRTGEANADVVEKEIAKEVESMINEIRNMEMKVVGNQSNSNEIAKCPKCGGGIIAGPKNYFCSNWKNGCKVSSMKKIMCEATISPKDFSNVLGGKTIQKKMVKNGSSWTQKLKYNIESCSWEFVK